MADRGARRIIACKAARRCDAGQVGQADEDRGIFGFADVLLDRDRLKPRRAFEVAPDPLHRIAIEVQQRLELAEDEVLVVEARSEEHTSALQSLMHTSSAD